MASNRAEVLKSMLAQDPNNTFARYGLAMELVSTGMLEQAVAEFETLLAANPDYGAGYFHGGQTLERLGRIEDAKAIYERGIAATLRTGDGHTRSELQGALDMLPI
jgi:tetratricopeptide (TPR) repeat protein